MTFEEDLTKRRIDVAAFAAGDPDKYTEWKEMYAQMHPNSFYVSVKMVLNDVRRKFWLAEVAKPIIATTDAPAKPVTRRASISGAGAPKPEAKPPVTAPAHEPTELPKPVATPGKGRAVIPRATPVKTETPETAESAPLPTDKPTSEEAPKAPPRARPVIRRPTPAGESTTTPTTDQEQIAQDNTNAAVPFHTNPDPEEEVASKPPRPRPIFKKPGAASPVEQPAAETPDTSLPTGEEPVAPVPEQTKTEGTKPPRPRPIFKRPAENATTTGPKPDTTTIPAGEKLNKEIEPATENNEAVPAAKPPRPRPVIRRPNPTPETQQPPVQPETTPLEVKSPEETPAPPATEPTKPPRPRPIFKRPAKPDDSNE